jgi:aminotransferase
VIIVEHLINNSVKEIKISGIRQFFNKVAKYPDAISLSIGIPDFPTPTHVKDAGKQAIDQNFTTYTHNAGLLELRKAIESFVDTKYGLQYDPESEIIATVGASEAIDISFRTILDPGCEVILPAPVYPGYEPVIRMCGATPINVDTTKTGFKMTAELIEKHLTDRTRCIVLPYPSNPTGCTLDYSEMEEIANLLKDKEIFILSDEIYSELTYGKKHVSIASFEQLKAKTIVINGLSKSHAMTGWRIGFILAPAYLSKHLLKVHQYNVTCVSTITQHAAIEALTNGINDAEAMRDEYANRLDYTYERLVDMGFDVVKPNGAFYIFPSIKQFHLDSFEFATALLETEGLAVVPGNAFGSIGNSFIRISYAYSKLTLEEGLDRLERFITKIK